jgi:hypothetical protein
MAPATPTEEVSAMRQKKNGSQESSVMTVNLWTTGAQKAKWCKLQEDNANTSK